MIDWQKKILLSLLTEKQIVWLYELKHYSDLVKWAITCSKDAAREIERASIVQEIEKKKLKIIEKQCKGDNEAHGKRNAALAAITKVVEQSKTKNSQRLRLKRKQKVSHFVLFNSYFLLLDPID